MNRVRIKCPEAGKSKSKRVNELFESVAAWIYSEYLQNLINLFGGRENLTGIGSNLKCDIDRIHDFAAIWDFRKGRERWAIEDEQFIKNNKEHIMEMVLGLGLKDISEPAGEPDFILPLGGARLANYVRPKKAREIIDKHDYKHKTIVALSGKRPLSEIEKPYIKDYAPEAQTEYEAISSGLEKTFGLGGYEEEVCSFANINLNSAVRKYHSTYNDCGIYSLAAPSSDPEYRRANSYDTFKYLLDHFDIHSGERLLLVTSSIYVPFQTLKFMDLAIEGGFEVDCIGSDSVDTGNVSNTSNYLQEVKGTIDAIYSLRQKYGEFI